MDKNTFKIGTDDTGRRFVYQDVDELDKNHRADNQCAVTEGRRYKFMCIKIINFSIIKFIISLLYIAITLKLMYVYVR